MQPERELSRQNRKTDAYLQPRQSPYTSTPGLPSHCLSPDLSECPILPGVQHAVLEPSQDPPWKSLS